MKRTFLMLAQVYKPGDHVVGWHASVKLDGIRCFWDGGVTRGMRKIDVPWANHLKDGRYKNEPICTGLWTRLGNIIHAPDWFLDALPSLPLDGELWTEKSRQKIVSAVKTLTPTEEWSDIKYNVFDSPSPEQFLKDGIVEELHYSKVFNGFKFPKAPEHVRRDMFVFNYQYLQQFVRSPVINVLQQTVVLDHLHLEKMLSRALDQGYEGLMLRAGGSVWEPRRSKFLLKYKPFQDAEAIVIGATAGKGKYLGMMGSLLLDFNGKTFEISGFTDKERLLPSNEKAIQHPGEPIESDEHPSEFPVGTTITFKHRGFTDDGIPQEARFMRVRELPEF